MDRKTYLSIWSVIFLVIVTVGLRLLFINSAFWYDEACSWFTAKQIFPFGIMDNLLNLDLQHTPLYFFILHFWMKIFGDSEIAIRSLSLLFGVVTVPLVFVLTKKLSNGLNAVFATCIASVAPLLVFFSVEARMYPIVLVWVLLSLISLANFEQKSDKKSLISLVIFNLLIPYTFVGGILYNITLMLSYSVYLIISKKDRLFTYLKVIGVELVCLIPYFALIVYYAKMRSLFIIKHEGPFVFMHFVDAIRNLFGLAPVNNVYWPSVDPYVLTLGFTLLVVVPCVYFLYGFVQGLKKSNGFNKFLYVLLLLIVVEFLITAICQINVFTVRYFLYLLPPFIILSVIGLAEKISSTHMKIVVALYCIVAICTNINYAIRIPAYKTLAFKSVKLEAVNLGLDNRDVIIMPFGADAPYYFRDDKSPKVLSFDFHKEVRNPYNKVYYDKSQQERILKGETHQVIYDAVFSNAGFSDSHFNFFINNVNRYVGKGRYVLIALYGSDADALVPIEDLRKSVTSVQDIKDRGLEIMLKKYLFDIRAYLDFDFELVKYGPKDNYTYLLMKKK